MDTNQDAFTSMQVWWENLPRYAGGMPARGTVAGSLIVLERLKDNYILELDYYRTTGKSQIQGVSGRAVQQIIERYGETRQFLSEGGRTNRGLAGDISALLDALRPHQLEALSSIQRAHLLSEMQKFLVNKVREYFSRERLIVTYDPTKTSWECIRALLQEARNNDKGGPVAEYLVGAKLVIRFPEIDVENKSFSTADAPSARPGDFIIGDTAFHVTVHPTPGHYQRCQQNIQQGMNVYLLVPDDMLAGARQIAQLIAPCQISVESIESFVSQNLDELSIFSKNQIMGGFSRLLQTYNQRVDAVENDKSLLLQIPHNLQGANT